MANPSPARPLYFAYGSNLSISQMRQRCIENPERSGKPLGIARIDHWKWIICEAGYANVLPPMPYNLPESSAEGCNIVADSADTTADTVYGLLYDMTPGDEKLLDGYEDIDDNAPDAPTDSTIDRDTRPKEQGKGDYNKWYVPATVEKWFGDEEEGLKPWLVDGSSTATATATNRSDSQKVIRALVYVDEYRVRDGAPREEYITRMNRAIEESTRIGFPQEWTQKVMRRFIPEGPTMALQN